MRASEEEQVGDDFGQRMSHARLASAYKNNEKFVSLLAAEQLLRASASSEDATPIRNSLIERRGFFNILAQIFGSLLYGKTLAGRLETFARSKSIADELRLLFTK